MNATDPAEAPIAPRYKQCPDCAEQVLAAARRCRFCDYRFDHQRSAGRSLLEGLFSGLRNAGPGGTINEILADWGSSLEPGESVEWFQLGDVDAQPGYLLVTSRRLLFFQQVGRTRHERALEYPRSLLSGVRLLGRGRNRRLGFRVGLLDHEINAPGRGRLNRLHTLVSTPVGIDRLAEPPEIEERER
jgi:hypothetical protein